MGKISELRKKSNKFVSNLDVHIAAIVDGNQRLLQMNKAQFKASKNAKGGPLINTRTGSADLSPAYAKRKNKRKPDIFDTGNTFRGMDIKFFRPSQYLIDSNTAYTKFLEEMYNNLFGISNQNKAKAITTPMLAARYKRFVL